MAVATEPYSLRQSTGHLIGPLTPRPHTERVEDNYGHWIRGIYRGMN